jgi:hypothetical protein
LSDADFEKNWATGIRKAFANRQRAEYRENIGGIIVSNTGIVLVSRPDLSDRPYRLFHPGDSTVWMMLDNRGNATGQFKLPNSFYPRVFRTCSLFGTDEDKDGTPLVVEYLIQSGC